MSTRQARVAGQMALGLKLVELRIAADRGQF